MPVDPPARPSARSASRPASCRAVSAAAQASSPRRAPTSVSISPPASSSAAITPIDFCASLAPWLNASAADIAHSPAADRRVPAPASRGVPRRRSARISSSAASAPSSGETASADERADHADRMPALEPAPVDRLDAALDERRSDEAADERVAGARRQARAATSATFQAIAASRPAPITAIAAAGADGHDAADRVGHRGPDQQRPEQVEDRRQQRPPAAAARRAWPRASRSRSRRSCSPFVTANASASAIREAHPGTSGPRRLVP